MEIPQIFQGVSNYYIIPWQKTKKKYSDFKEKKGIVIGFLANFTPLLME